MGLLLRHPVVITSLEEDFRRIGLIKTEEARDEGDDLQEHLMESTEDFDAEDEPEEGEDEATEDADEDDEAMAEAVAFHEDAMSMWQEFGESGVETLFMDEESMAELESMGESITELPLAVVGASIEEYGDEYEGEEVHEDDEAEDDEEEGEEYGEDDEPANPFASVAEAMSAIESILDEDAQPTDSLEEATPAFANLALISEKLYGFFAETAEIQEDAEYAEIAEAYKQIAHYSAAIVDTLQKESPDTINFDALTETFQDYLGTVLQGLETYAILREADESGDEDGETDEGEEQDEGDEGNE